MGVSDEEFMSEKIKRTTVQRDFRPLEISDEQGVTHIKFSPQDAIAFANLLLSQALIADTHSTAVVTVRCSVKAGERIQIISAWIDAETTEEADVLARLADGTADDHNDEKAPMGRGSAALAVLTGH